MLASFAAALLFLQAPAEAPPRVLSNGWFYGEAGNGCRAARELADGTRLIMNLTRWRDLSDSLILSKPGLAPLWSEPGWPSGRTEAEERADGDAGYHLSVHIDGRVVPGTPMNSMLLAFQGRPGPSWRFGIRREAFLAALRTGRRLELRRRGRVLAAFPIRGSADMARRMAVCVARPSRFP
jgi:hypothetical protein